MNVFDYISGSRASVRISNGLGGGATMPRCIIMAAICGKCTLASAAPVALYLVASSPVSLANLAAIHGQSNPKCT